MLAHAHVINAGPIFSRVGPSSPEHSEERRKNGARIGLEWTMMTGTNKAHIDAKKKKKERKNIYIITCIVINMIIILICNLELCL